MISIQTFYLFSFQVPATFRKVGRVDGSNRGSKATSSSTAHTSKPKGNVKKCKATIFFCTTSKFQGVVLSRHSIVSSTTSPFHAKLYIDVKLTRVYFLPFSRHGIQYPTNRTLVSYHLAERRLHYNFSRRLFNFPFLLDEGAGVRRSHFPGLNLIYIHDDNWTSLSIWPPLNGALSGFVMLVLNVDYELQVCWNGMGIVVCVCVRNGAYCTYTFQCELFYFQARRLLQMHGNTRETH